MHHNKCNLSPLMLNSVSAAFNEKLSSLGPHVPRAGVIIEFPDKNCPHLVLATATGATARKGFIYDVILSEYLATGCYRCYSCCSSQGVYL